MSIGLLENVATLLDEAEAIVNEAEAAKRPLTAEELARIDAITKTSDRAHDLMEGRSAGRKTEPNAIEPAFRDRHTDVRDAPVHRHTLPRGAGAVGRRVQDLFGERVGRDTGGFRDIADFFTAVLSGRMDPRLRRHQFQDIATEGSGPGGGFTVPPQFLAAILDPSVDDEIVRPRAMVHPVTSASLTIPSPDMTDHSTSIMGFSATWTGEATDPGEQTPKWRQQILIPKKIFIRGKASNELLADSPSAMNDIMYGLRQATAFGLDSAFLTGTGVGQPRGILSDSALISVAKVSGQAADTLRWENISAMWAKLHPASHRRAVWLCHPTCLPELLKVSVPVRNVADSENVGGSHLLMGSADGYSMLGRPLIITEHCHPLGDKGDLMLVDFQHMHIGLRSDAAIQVSNIPGWTDDTTHFRLILRVDGLGGWPGALTLKDGSTVSWCVCIDERS